MAVVQSTMLALGTPLPEFSLPDTVSGNTISTANAPADKPVLVMFICNHCPYVVHVREELARLGRDYRDRVTIIAISSNDVATHPKDGPEHMRDMAVQFQFEFPYCYDESQAVAKAFHAECTPDLFLFDAEKKLVYRGQLDESRPGNGKPVSGADLRQAIDNTLRGEPVSPEQRPSMGCNIKWKDGR